MKKSILIACGTIVLCTAAWLIVIRNVAPVSIQAKWIDGLYARKEHAARLVSDRPKVLIIGGSGAHYGFSAETITNTTGVTTINFGVHAGLGAAYLLDRAKLSLNAGDTAVVALEPSFFPTAPSDVLSEYVLHFDWSYLLRTDFKTAVRIIFGFGPDKFLRVMYLRSIPWTSLLGRADSVSETTGDEALQVSRFATPSDRERVSASGPLPLALPPEAPSYLQDFLAWARANSVNVIEAWTPMLNNTAYLTEAYKSYFATVAGWYQGGGATSLPDPSAFFLSIDEIFDYVLHANEHGRAKASIALANRLMLLPARPLTLARRDRNR
jgi:hypothetical protein